MTIFDERERTFEQIFVHDEDLRFRALARRNRLLGLWAAQQMRFTKDQAAQYASQLADIITYQDGDQRVARRILLDMQAHGLEQSEHQLQHIMADLMSTALAQVRIE